MNNKTAASAKIEIGLDIPPRLYALAEQMAKLSACATAEAYIEHLIARDLAPQSAAAKFPFLTVRSAEVVDRVCREHGLTPEQFVAMAVEQHAEWFEEDIAGCGVCSGGENEWCFVIDAKELAAGESDAWRFHPTCDGYAVAKVDFFAIFKDRVPRLQEECGEWVA